jgi:hypothetical protein
MSQRTPPRIARGASALLNRAKGSFSSPAGKRGGAAGGGGGGGPSSSRTKSPAVSSAADGDHAANNGGGDDDVITGAREIIGDAPVHSGNTLEKYVLPRSLRMDVVDEYGNGGMEVIKVSKVGMSFYFCCRRLCQVHQSFIQFFCHFWCKEWETTNTSARHRTQQSRHLHYQSQTSTPNWTGIGIIETSYRSQ